jgi:hypothetical protein
MFRSIVLIPSLQRKQCSLFIFTTYLYTTYLNTVNVNKETYVQLTPDITREITKLFLFQDKSVLKVLF